MLFIAIGLIIFFTTLLAALILLVRELGQRSTIDDSINDYSLDFADDELPKELSRFDSDNMQQSQPVSALPQEAQLFSSPPSLDEVVPFPWEIASESQFEGEEKLQEFQETNLVSNEPVIGRLSGNLNDQFSLSDLAKKD